LYGSAFAGENELAEKEIPDEKILKKPNESVSQSITGVLSQTWEGQYEKKEKSRRIKDLGSSKGR